MSPPILWDPTIRLVVLVFALMGAISNAMSTVVIIGEVAHWWDLL